MMVNFADILGIGTTELIIILAILLLLFGAKKLPELSRSLGSSARELKKGLTEDSKDEKKNEKKTEQPNNAGDHQQQ